MRTTGWVGLAVLLAVGQANGEEPALKGNVTISGAWALYPMAVRWGEEFNKLHPQVRFDTSAGGAGKGIADALSGAVDIGLVSREVTDGETKKGAVSLAVARDAVVPVINVKHPALNDLLRKGVTRQAFEGLWIKGTLKTWDQAAAGLPNLPIRVYTRSDACGAAETWARFLGGRQEDLKGTGVYGDPGLAEAVRKDPLGIGYNNVNFAYDPKTALPVAGLAILPLDRDGNGQVDNNEQFYATRNDLTAAIARGDYPSPPARDLYFVVKGTPRNPVVVAFIQWVMTGGQALLDESGYLAVSPERLQADRAKLPAAR